MSYTYQAQFLEFNTRCLITTTQTDATNISLNHYDFKYMDLIEELSEVANQIRLCPMQSRFAILVTSASRCLFKTVVLWLVW